MRLAGQVVWITGSAKRLGREMALGCAREGADVVVHCRNSREEAEATASEIRELGRQCLVVQGDHSAPGDVDRMVSEIAGEFGKLNGLVNSASEFPQKNFEDVSPEEFDQVIRSNLKGPFLCAQRALPLLRKSSPGRIVNITDWSVHRPYSRYSHYMASKGGLETLTLALARELAPGILVNGIAPGPMLEPEDLDSEIEAKIAEKSALGRWGKPESVVKALLFVLECEDLCGEVIRVDAGRYLG